MLGFSFGALLLILLALAFLLPPLLKKRVVSQNMGQRDLTISIYRDQFDELENDLKNGTVSQEQYEKAKNDVERNLLSDLKQFESDEEPAPVVGGVGRITAVIVGIAVPLFAISLYAKFGAGEIGLDPKKAAEVATAGGDQHSTQSIDSMIAQLEQRLQDEPDDGEGWFMLAKTYQFTKRYPEAVTAYQRVVQLGGGQDPNVLASYADALAMASGRQLTKESVALLEQALQLDPGHIKALWLAGTAAYQNKNYPDALNYWERLYAAMPEGEDRNQILSNVNEVRSLLGKAPVNVLPTVSSAGPSSSSAKTASAAVGNKSISGNVALGGAVAAKASPEDTVFVFARAAEGPRMPLAIVRKQVKDLPFEFTLDDSMAMNPTMKLSSFARVVVGARISKTGNAMKQAGDLEGMSGAIKVGDAGRVKLVIDTVVN